MIKDTAIFVMAIVIVAGTYFGLLAMVIQSDTIDEIRDQAISRGHALYCPTDGEFAWVGECASVVHHDP